MEVPYPINNYNGSSKLGAPLEGPAFSPSSPVLVPALFSLDASSSSPVHVRGLISLVHTACYRRS
jgi:hypothetical protein